MKYFHAIHSQKYMLKNFLNPGAHGQGSVISVYENSVVKYMNTNTVVMRVCYDSCYEIIGFVTHNLH